MSKSIYPSIPFPGTTPAQQQACLLAIKQTLELIIVNAQDPRPDYDLTTAAQVFLTVGNYSRLTAQPLSMIRELQTRVAELEQRLGIMETSDG